MLSIDSQVNVPVPVVRSGARGGKYVATVKVKADWNARPGMLVRWLGPSNY